MGESLIQKGKKVLISHNISRYIYIFYYAYLNQELPKWMAGLIRNCNQKQLRAQYDSVPRLKLDTYDGSGQAVHPDLVEWRNKLWMVCTPYPYSTDTYENPCIYSGENCYTLEPHPGCRQPLAFPQYRGIKNHISDPCIFVFQDTLHVIYRDTVFEAGITEQKTYLTRSCDGAEWETPKLIERSMTDSLISPAVVVDENTIIWKYHVTLTTEFGGILTLSSSCNGLDWYSNGHLACTGVPEGMTIWHIAVAYKEGFSKSCGANNSDKSLIGLFALRKKGDKDRFELFWACSDSVGESWRIESAVNLFDDRALHSFVYYKSALLPNTGDIFLSIHDEKNRWYFTVVTNDYCDLMKTTDGLYKTAYRIFIKTFQNRVSYRRYIYKHQLNPYSLSKEIFLYKLDGKYVGTNAFLGCLLNMCETQLTGIQSCDTAVLPAAQGYGIFSHIIKEAEQYYKDQHVVLFGFPNKNSYHGFIKLGWRDLGEYITYVLIQRPGVILAMKLHLVGSNALECEHNIPGKIRRACKINFLEQIFEYKTCPFTEEEISVINQQGKYVSIKRSKSYFQWKIDNTGADGYRYRVLRSDGILYGYLIYKKSLMGYITIVDWFLNPDTETDQTTILASLLVDFSKCSTCLFFPMIKPGSAECAMRLRLGFFEGQRFGLRLNSSRLVVKSEECTSADWRLRAIDLDSFFNKTEG